MTVLQLPAGIPFESNPYPAQIPTALQQPLGINGYLFFRTLVETIREQQSVILSGGSTFSWTLLTQTTSDQQFTPGSSGRFLHPLYGMIAARYCQLVNPGSGLNPGGPVDAVLSGGIFNWTASQEGNYTRTLGLLGGYNGYNNADFGWVIEHGINIQAIKYTGTAPGVGSRLTRDYATLDALKVAGATDQWVATSIAAASGGMINPATLLIHSG